MKRLTIESVELNLITREVKQKNMRRGPKRIEIKTVENYQDVVNDMLTDFLEGFTKEQGLIRDPNQDDLDNFDGVDVSFIYTQKGMKLYETACRRYSELGEKIFNEPIECCSSAILMS